MMAGGGISDLTERMAAAGAPLEAMLLAVKVLEARDHADAERKARSANVDPQKRTAELRSEYARRWGGEAKPPDLSSIMKGAGASMGGESSFGSGHHGR